LLLNAKLQITHEVMVYRGTLSTPLTRQAELLKEAIRLNGSRKTSQSRHDWLWSSL